MTRSLFLLVPALCLVGCDNGVDDCEDPGAVCAFVGQPGVAQFTAEGLPREQTATYLVQDLTFQPGTNDAFFLDFNNHRVRRITADGKVNTVLGTGFLGDGPEGEALLVAMNHPTNLAFDPADPERLHVAAWHNSRLERVDLRTSQMHFSCGTGARDFGGDGGPAVDAMLDLPSSIAFHEDGRLFISDQANQLIRMVNQDDVITTIAGRQRDPGYSGDGGPALEAQLNAQIGQAADPSSRLIVHGDMIYMADTSNHVVRTVDLNTMIIDTFAGTGEIGVGEEGDRTEVGFNAPRDVAMGPDGALYVADTDNHCVRRVLEDGMVETVVGTCGQEGVIEGVMARQDVLLNKPYGIAFDEEGVLYVADTYNHAILRVTPDKGKK